MLFLGVELFVVWNNHPISNRNNRHHAILIPVLTIRICFESCLGFVHLVLPFSLEKAHLNKRPLVVGICILLLLLEYEVVQIDLVAANGEVVAARKRLQIVKAVPTKYYILNILYHIIRQVFLQLWWAAHDAPGLA